MKDVFDYNTNTRGNTGISTVVPMVIQKRKLESCKNTDLNKQDILVNHSGVC